MKVIGINGSPRINGSTSMLISWILEGAREQGATTEIINLSELDLNYCQGCNQCLTNKKCVLKDDFDELMEKIMSSDGIVLGSPVYEGYPSAQMKTLMDRVALLTLYAGIFEGKLSVGVATSGIAPTKKTSSIMADIFGARIGCIGHKTAQISKGYKALSQSTSPKLYKKANNLGKKLVNKLNTSSGLRLVTIKSKWIFFLRKYLLKNLVLKNKDAFSGVIQMRPDLYKS